MGPDLHSTLPSAHGSAHGLNARDALEGEGPQRRPQRRLGRQLEEVAKAVGGGYCRLQMPLAPGVRTTVAWRRLGTLEGGLPMHPCDPQGCRPPHHTFGPGPPPEPSPAGDGVRRRGEGVLGQQRDQRVIVQPHHLHRPLGHVDSGGEEALVVIILGVEPQQEPPVGETPNVGRVARKQSAPLHVCQAPMEVRVVVQGRCGRGRRAVARGAGLLQLQALAQHAVRVRHLRGIVEDVQGAGAQRTPNKEAPMHPMHHASWRELGRHGHPTAADQTRAGADCTQHRVRPRTTMPILFRRIVVCGWCRNPAAKGGRGGCHKGSASVVVGSSGCARLFKFWRHVRRYQHQPPALPCAPCGDNVPSCMCWINTFKWCQPEGRAGFSPRCPSPAAVCGGGRGGGASGSKQRGCRATERTLGANRLALATGSSLEPKRRGCVVRPGHPAISTPSSIMCTFKASHIFRSAHRT